MQAQDFLVELGTEELPPKALKKLAEAFLAGVEGGLKDAGLGYAKARYYAAPPGRAGRGAGNPAARPHHPTRWPARTGGV